MANPPTHSLLPHPSPIEIRIGDVTLAAKLDALGAALVAVREAHRDGMPVECWAQINRAHEALGAAILYAGSPALPTLTINSERSHRAHRAQLTERTEQGTGSDSVASVPPL